MGCYGHSLTLSSNAAISLVALETVYWGRGIWGHTVNGFKLALYSRVAPGFVGAAVTVTMEMAQDVVAMWDYFKLCVFAVRAH